MLQLRIESDHTYDDTYVNYIVGYVRKVSVGYLFIIYYLTYHISYARTLNINNILVLKLVNFTEC